MKKTHTILIWLSFISSVGLLLAAMLLVGMVALAPHLSNVDALFKWTCAVLKHGFPLGLLFGIPAFIFAVVLRSRLICSIIALLLGALVVGAWWIVGSIPVGF